MKNIKINIDRKPLSSEEIAAGKNFNQVLQGAKMISKPFYQTKWFLGNTIAVIVSVSAVLVYFGTKDNTDTDTFIQSDLLRPTYVSAPIPKANIPYNGYTIDAETGGTIVHKSGSEILIPKNAFISENGDTVTGDVIIEYREMHNPVDIFLTGIPMEYDSAGTKYNLESAGMIDIRGFKNGKEIAIAPGKEIAIELRSDKSGTDYNLYELDTNAQNWVFKGKDKVTETTQEPASEETKVQMVRLTESDYANVSTPEQLQEKEVIESNIKAIKQEIAELQSTAPLEPKKARKSKWNFAIEVNPTDFPEISEYQNTLWEVDESKKKFNPEYAKTEWEDVVISKGSLENSYEIAFTKASQTVKFVTSPVYEGNNYAEAKKVYDAKFENYSSKLETKQKKEAEFEKSRQEWLAAESKRRQEIDRLRANQEKAQVEYSESYIQTENNITRSFTINNFGVWNCDRPISVKNEEHKQVTFTDQNGAKIKGYTINVVNKTYNTLYRFYPKNDTYKIEYDKKEKNSIWAVTASNKLAYLKAADFNNSFSEDSSKSIKLTVVDYDFTSDEDFKEIYESDFENIPVGDKKAKLSVKAYPTTFREIVTLDANFDNSFDVKIYSINGKLVKQLTFSGTTQEVNLHDIAIGNYIVRVFCQEQNLTSETSIIKI